jgi:hypothetical protein
LPVSVNTPRAPTTTAAKAGTVKAATLPVTTNAAGAALIR